ncbi:MAG TPA: DUF928 domain-containing protein [Methylomirabilota bacterium]|nr:DUF928 domain-containing protein [Methylomirabilota bacterium]
MSTWSKSLGMGRIAIATLALWAASVVAPVVPSEGQTKPPADPPTETSKVTASAPSYKPPLRGAPGGRVGGGTRGTGREAFILSVLAPSHTGLTTSEQPVLYWFISSPSSHPVELTLVDPQKSDPLIELRIPPPVAAGVHRIRLSEHNVRLDPAVAYQWYVAVMPDTGRRSKDILAGASLERVAPPADLTAKISRTAKADLPALYAGEGLWYDAIAALNDLIDEAPQNAALKAQRSALLREVGLPDTTVE